MMMLNSLDKAIVRIRNQSTVGRQKKITTVTDLHLSLFLFFFCLPCSHLYLSSQLFLISVSLSYLSVSSHLYISCLSLFPPLSHLSFLSSLVSLLISISLLFHISSLFLLSMTMTVITGSVNSLCALSASMDLGPVVDWRQARLIPLSGYTCVERVPLEIKWACTCAGDGC